MTHLCFLCYFVDSITQMSQIFNHHLIYKCSCGSSQYWDVDAEEFDFDGEHYLHTANLDLSDPAIPVVEVPQAEDDEQIDGGRLE